MSGPNDITIAKPVIIPNTPAGDSSHRLAAPRVLRDAARTIAAAMLQTISTRDKLVILSPGGRMENPNSSVATTAAAMTIGRNRRARRDRRENVWLVFFPFSAVPSSVLAPTPSAARTT